MARPKKQAHERRSASLPPIAVTIAEQGYVTEQAELAGLSVTEYVRTLALTQTVRPRKTRLEADALSELNRIGVNLNQLSHSANIGRTDEAKLIYAIDELVALMKRLDQAL